MRVQSRYCFNIVNSTTCVTIALLFDGAVVGGREGLVLMIQIRTPNIFDHKRGIMRREALMNNLFLL